MRVRWENLIMGVCSTAFIFVAIFYIGCQPNKDHSSSENAGPNSKPGCQAAGTCNSTGVPPQDNTVAPFTMGIPSYCRSEAMGEEGSLLISCRPRIVDIVKLITDMPKDFNIADDCVYTETEVKCNVVGDFDFILSLESGGGRESLYDEIPTLNQAINRYLKLVNLSEDELKNVDAILKSITDHRSDLLNGNSFEIAGVVTSGEDLTKALKALARSEDFDAHAYVAETGKMLGVARGDTVKSAVEGLTLDVMTQKLESQAQQNFRMLLTAGVGSGIDVDHVLNRLKGIRSQKRGVK